MVIVDFARGNLLNGEAKNTSPNKRFAEKFSEFDMDTMSKINLV